jgi:uncharacterized protein
MEVRAYDDASRFRIDTDSLLLSNEARNNLILGVSQTLIDRPDAYDSFEGWVIDQDGEAVVAAARTPPWRLILGDATSESGVAMLAETLDDLPGVVGNRPWVDIFVERRGSGRKTMSQGVFELTEVVPPAPAPGNSRLAGQDDLQLLMAWIVAFQEEAAQELDPNAAQRGVSRRIEGPPERAAMWIYEIEGEAVAMSGNGGPTPNGIRIGPVYTPPEHRGNGYASNLVAAQSQWLLDHGKNFCFLYTDLANPTSNSIYKRIGYRQIAESAEFSF